MTQRSSEKIFCCGRLWRRSSHIGYLFLKAQNFYDKDGSAKLIPGDLKFSANSPARILRCKCNGRLLKAHPYRAWRLAFEFHYLSPVESIHQRTERIFFYLMKDLRFDKIYFQTEVPFKYDTDKKYSFNWNVKMGWFGYTNVKRF